MSSKKSPNRSQYILMLIMFFVWSAVVIRLFDLEHLDEYSYVRFIASVAWVGGLYFIASRIFRDQW